MDMSIERNSRVTSAIAENLKVLKGSAVGIDIDAVTQATFILALNHASHNLRKVILKEKLTGYWELANIARANGISDDKALEFAKNAWNRNDVYLKSPAMPGITTLMEIFNCVDIPYFFISSRPVEFLETTHEWFTRTFPWVKEENIVLGRPEGVSGGVFKAAEIRKRKILLHLEDALEEASVIVDKTPAGVLVVPQPWNASERIDNPRIKQLGPYSDTDGVWPVIRFLASREAKAFLNNVAQY